MSLTASGTIGKAITFATWKGIAYARTRVIPANPNTNAQKEVRGVFSTLCEMWKRIPQPARIPWITAVKGRPLTARNLFIQKNVPALIDDANLDDLVMSVSSGASVPPATITPADGGGQSLTIAATAGTTPPGYTLIGICFAAVLDGDPSPLLVRDTFAESDVVDPYTVDLAVGVAGSYQCAAFMVYLRDSDERVFYSAALRDQQDVA
ncbi:hypothetical protein ES705_19294 [subsurface metagenome]